MNDNSVKKKASGYQKKTDAIKYGARAYKDNKNSGLEHKNDRSDRKREENNHKKKPEVSGCPAARKCGGCQYQGVSYAKQLKLKQKAVEDLLKGYGRLQPIIGMKDPLYYRCKVHHVFDRLKNGTIISGTYEANSHQVVPVKDCLIEDRKSQAIMETICGLLKSFKIKVYDEDTGYGLLRHVLIRRGYYTGEYMVILVLVSPILPSKNNFVNALRKEHPEITTVVLNINDKRTSMVLGPRDIVLYGPGFIKDQLCGCTFRISPQSFYQVNPVQTEILYNTAIQFADLKGTETVIDAYCGTGTIGLAAARHAAKVIGVELNKDAVRDARINARENKQKNAEFYQGDAGEFMMEMAANGQKADVVIMDPPRSGSTEEFINAMAQMKPEKIVYVSCNPETQARDLGYLVKKGYKVRKMQPVDLFPFTEHVENICLLSRKATV